jgi:regulation of enolase protein 1 (concanavalin A-like superfamily)
MPTDIWRKPGPPEVKSFNAPILYKTIPLSTFKRARVTVTGNWSRLYDQGGLVLVLQDKNVTTGNKDQRWVKTGIEFYQGEVFVGTVGADRWSDWSLVQVGIQDGKTVTLEMEGDGDTLWIYVVDGEKRIPIREVPWILSAGGKDVQAWVGVYAASPKPDGNELEVNFDGWELELGSELEVGNEFIARTASFFILGNKF